jgi:methionyl-tRNA synthetase
MTIDDFLKVELRTARVMEAERVEGSEKLIRMQLNAGDKDEAGASVTRQVLAGMGKNYAPEELVGKDIVIVANLEPRKLMGFESRGMMLAASDAEGKVAFLTVEKPIEPGSGIR